MSLKRTLGLEMRYIIILIIKSQSIILVFKNIRYLYSILNINNVWVRLITSILC